MTPDVTVFTATYTLAGLAAVCSLVGDALKRQRFAVNAAGLLLVGAGVVSLVAAWSLPGVTSVADEAFRVGRAHSLVPGLVFVLAGAAALASGGRGKSPGQDASLVALAAISASLAATATGLVSLLAGVEGAALCAHALVARGCGSRASEASFKYFVQGSVATGLYALGLALIVGLYAPDGNVITALDAIGATGGVPIAASLGILGIVSAIAFKAGAAPFHSWAPDAYETAPASSASFLAGPVKVAMITALVTFTLPLARLGGTTSTPYGEVLFEVFGVLAVMAILSIVIGSTVALTTGSYRRMLGYAGVAQVGYALVALSALGGAAALLFIVTYAIAAATAFLAAEYFERTEPAWDGTIAGLAGAGRRHPGVAAALSVALISSAGIPPLVGFWGKFRAFGAAVNAATAFAGVGEPAFAVLLVAAAVTGVIGSVVSIAYYGRVVRTLYFETTEEVAEYRPEAGRTAAGLVLAGAAIIVFAGVAPLVFGYAVPLQAFLLN